MLVRELVRLPVVRSVTLTPCLLCFVGVEKCESCHKEHFITSYRWRVSLSQSGLCFATPLLRSRPSNLLPSRSQAAMNERLEDILGGVEEEIRLAEERLKLNSFGTSRPAGRW